MRHGRPATDPRGSLDTGCRATEGSALRAAHFGGRLWISFCLFGSRLFAPASSATTASVAFVLGFNRLDKRCRNCCCCTEKDCSIHSFDLHPLNRIPDRQWFPLHLALGSKSFAVCSLPNEFF